MPPPFSTATTPPGDGDERERDDSERDDNDHVNPRHGAPQTKDNKSADAHDTNRPNENDENENDDDNENDENENHTNNNNYYSPSREPQHQYESESTQVATTLSARLSLEAAATATLPQATTRSPRQSKTKSLLVHDRETTAQQQNPLLPPTTDPKQPPPQPQPPRPALDDDDGDENDNDAVGGGAKKRMGMHQNHGMASRIHPVLDGEPGVSSSSLASASPSASASLAASSPSLAASPRASRRKLVREPHGTPKNAPPHTNDPAKEDNHVIDNNNNNNNNDHPHYVDHGSAKVPTPRKKVRHSVRSPTGKRAPVILLSSLVSTHELATLSPPLMATRPDQDANQETTLENKATLPLKSILRRTCSGTNATGPAQSSPSAAAEAATAAERWHGPGVYHAHHRQQPPSHSRPTALLTTTSFLRSPKTQSRKAKAIKSATATTAATATTTASSTNYATLFQRMQQQQQ